MIRVALVRNVFEPSRGREEFEQAWRDGLRVRDLVPAGWDHARVHAFEGPVRVDLDTVLHDHTRLTLALAPGFTPVTAALFSLLVFSSFVLRSFAPKPPRVRKDDSSATYGFSGISTNRTEGEPIGMPYGRRIIGGQIVAEFIENRGALGSFYNAIVSYGEGPVHRLMDRTTDTEPDAPLRSGSASNPIPHGWLFVNDGDAADLDDCEVHVRLGTNEQLAIPGFAVTTQTVTVDADIRGPVADYDGAIGRNYGEPLFANGNRNPVLASDGVTSSNVLWDEHGTAFSMTTTADEFSVTVEFPEGLGKTASDGFPLAWYWGLGLRYIELDGAGDPIASGGTEGDGYVRPPAVPTYLARYAPGQRVDLRFPFYDPQTYERPAFSRVLRCNPAGSSVTAYLSRADFRPYQLSLDETVMDAFSFEAWVCLRPTDVTQPTSDTDELSNSDLTEPAPIISWYSTSALRKGGFELSMRAITIPIAPGQTRLRLIPVLSTIDTAGASTSHYERKGEVGDVTFQANLTRQKTTPNYDWFHVVGTYKRDVDGSLDRVRLFANGELIYEGLGAWNVGYPMTSSSVGIQARMGTDVAGSDFFKGWLDNVVLWAGEMTVDDVRLAYAGGLGRTLPAGDTTYSNPDGTTRLLTQGVWTFDSFVAPGDGLGSGESVPDSSTFGLHFTTSLQGGAPTSYIALGSASDAGFIGVASTTNVRKRGRYRVEVIRGLRLVDDVAVQDGMRWVALQLHTDGQYTHPGSPLLGVRIRADGEISGSAPNLKALGEWRLLPEWDGASATRPTFVRRWSRNPAWVCLDVALDPDAGLSWIFSPEDIDVEAWREFADFCDEVVYDQRGGRREFPAWTDMLYSSVLLGTEPGIEIRVPTGTGPRHWVVGSYLGWYGLPAITAGGGPYEDTNVDPTAGGGYEIVAVIVNPGGAGTDFYRVRWTGALAPWTNGTLLSTQITGSLEGTIEGREPRFLDDSSKDEAGSAWDFLVEVCAAARAVPVRLGTRLSVRVDKPRPVRDVLGQAQIVPGSFEYEMLSPRTRVNAIDISFPDADQSYDRSPAYDEHPSIRGTAALSDVRRRSYSLDGVTRRSQVLRHARYLLNREYLIRRRGRMRASVDMLGYEPGDVLQVAHDVADRGIAGRVLERVSDTVLKLDREVTIASGKDYRIRLRYQSAPDGEEPELLEVDTATTGLGTFKGWEGDEITVTAAMAREAQKGDAFIWYEVGKPLFVSIDNATLARNLEREVSFSQYDEDVFDVEGRDDLADVDSEHLAVAAPARNADSVPLPPTVVRVRELTPLSASGTSEQTIEVRWQRSAAQVGVAGYDVFVGGRGAWVRAATLDAGADRAVVSVPGSRRGQVVNVSVVARSPAGRSRSPDAGTRASVRILNRPLAPASPTALFAALSAELAVFSWTPGEVLDSVFYELRRGGWILGQPVHLSGPGETSLGSSPAWVTSAPIADGSRPPVPYLVRARTRAGSFSGAARALWNPRATDYRSIADGYANAFWTESWELFGDGWHFTAPTSPNATLDGLQVNAEGWLEFAGSALSGSYTTPEPDLSGGARPEHVQLSAHVEAEQIHPLTWDDLAFSWDDPTSCWTWEGPLDVVADGEDPGRCTLALQVRLRDEAGTWGNWQDYRPCRARALAAQFRINVTRPSTDFDVRIHRFSIDLQRVPRQRWERSPLQALSEQKVLRRG